MNVQPEIREFVDYREKLGLLAQHTGVVYHAECYWSPSECIQCIYTVILATMPNYLCQGGTGKANKFTTIETLAIS